MKTDTAQPQVAIPQSELEHTSKSLLNRYKKHIEIGRKYF